MRTLLTSLVLAALMIPGASVAADVSKGLKSFAALNIKPWLKDPVIINALKAQNAVTTVFDQPTIDALDLQWRDLVKSDVADPMITAVTEGEAADFLKSKADRSRGNITEVILMDAKGLNVAATAAPSDYWQGDEDKFINSFGAGPDGVDTGEVEYDTSTNIYSAQISYPVSDPDTGELLGAITVGVSTSALD